MKDVLDKNKCRHCIHGDGNGECITKIESPFGGFVCRHNEEYEDWVDVEDNDLDAEDEE